VSAGGYCSDAARTLALGSSEPLLGEATLRRVFIGFDGRSLKWLSIVDEYTRECLALEVGRSITAEKVIDVLTELLHIRAVPQHIRSE
jgi:hypothetical protein